MSATSSYHAYGQEAKFLNMIQKGGIASRNS